MNEQLELFQWSQLGPYLNLDSQQRSKQLAAGGEIDDAATKDSEEDYFVGSFLHQFLQ